MSNQELNILLECCAQADHLACIINDLYIEEKMATEKIKYIHKRLGELLPRTGSIYVELKDLFEYSRL